MRIPSIPFKVLALAPFGFELQEAWKKAPVPIDLSDLDHVIESLGIFGYFSLSRDLCPAGGVEIKIFRLKDFHPDALIKSNSFLGHLQDARQVLSDSNLSSAEKRQMIKDWQDLPDLPIADAPPKANETGKEAATELDNILNMVAMPEAGGSAPSASVSGDNPADAIMQAVLADIYSDKSFKAAEAAWRGVKRLLQQGAQSNGDVKLEVVPVNMDTLEETIGALTVRLVDDLPSLILVDLPFENTPNSLALLERVAQFAEILMAPALVWASPGLMGLDAWSGLNRLSFIPNYLDAPHFAKFNRLKSQSEANWLAMGFNRYLPRPPYGSENPPRNFPFKEPELAWSSPIWAISALILQSFGESGWPTRFTEWQVHQLSDLAVHSIDAKTAIPTETLISEDRMDQCRRAGLMALAARANRDVVFLPMETTIGGASLAYQLFASRVTQFFLWCKDNLSTDLSGQALEQELKRMTSLLWEKSGHAGPDQLEITASPPDEENRTLLRIDLHPSRKILPSGEGLTLEFKW